MPITKARLDRMIDMIDSAWLKRRDSEGRNTDPKQFNESAPQQPFSDSPHLIAALRAHVKIRLDLNHFYCASRRSKRWPPGIPQAADRAIESTQLNLERGFHLNGPA